MTAQQPKLPLKPKTQQGDNASRSLSHVRHRRVGPVTPPVIPQLSLPLYFFLFPAATIVGENLTHRALILHRPLHDTTLRPSLMATTSTIRREGTPTPAVGARTHLPWPHHDDIAANRSPRHFLDRAAPIPPDGISSSLW